MSFNAQVLVIGGGGSSNHGASGAVYPSGGAGSVPVYDAAHAITYGQSYAVTVGAGGGYPGGLSDAGSDGGNSIFDGLTSTGGGHPSTYSTNVGASNASYTGGTGTLPLSGGGGAGGGANGIDKNGGTGVHYSISGASVGYCGGGSSASGGNSTGTAVDGGGDFNNAPRANSGGGGSSISAGANGCVIISYPTPSLGDGTGGTITHVAGNTIHTFTVSGTFVAPIGIASPVLNDPTMEQSSALLSWSAISSAVSYTLKYGTASGVYTTTVVLGNVTSYEVDGLASRTQYFFVVTVTDGTNVSANSNEVSGTTKTVGNEPPPPVYSILLTSIDKKIISILNKQVTALQFEYNRIGGDGICTMTCPISYESLPNLTADANLQIFDFDDTGAIQLFYQGYLESKEPMLDINNVFNLSFTGYSGQLKRVRINKTYNNTEISLIVKDILDNFVVPNTGISYNSSDITVTNFVPDVIEFDDLADVALQTLADLAGNVEWGVDRFKNFFFKTLSDQISHVLKISKEVKVVDPIYDYSIIINRIVIKGGTLPDGSNFEEESDNTESQALYGLRTQIVSNSAIVTSPVAQQYGSSLLAQQARITMRSRIDINKNTKLFEKVLPLGAFSLLTQPVPKLHKYGDSDAIYGTGFIYGSRSSFQVERMTYTLTDEGWDVEINGGSQTPDISLHIKRLEYQISQLTRRG